MFILLFGGGALLVGMILHVAWIAKRAEAKGRSAVLWAVTGVALACIGLKLGLVLFARAADTENGLLTFVYMSSPITLSIGPMIVVVLVLLTLPVRIDNANSWPVHHARDGAGMLVIDDSIVELRWAGRTDRVARTTLTATADQESLRLAWPEHEILVMPGGKPANREGRMRQAQIIAARLRR